MEQSDIPQVLVLKIEEVPADINIQTTQITNQDVETVSVIEDNQDLPNAYKLPEESMVDNVNINVETVSEEYMDTSQVDVSTKEIDGNENDVANPKLSEPEMEVCTSEEERINIYEQTKDEIMDFKPQYLSSEEDQSSNVITESKVIEVNKEATDVESGCNVIENANQSDTVHRQCSTLDKARLSENSEDQIHESHESVKEIIKEIHDNDSNQNNSIITDAELTKLVQEDGEVIVVVETIPITTDAAADNYIVLDEKEASKCSQENIVTLQEERIVETNHGENEINLIDYSQESEGTIIEVTEVIDATEQCEQQDNKECIENSKYDTELENVTEIAIESVRDENIEPNATDSKTLVSSASKEDNVTIIIDKKITNTEDADSEVKTDISQNENIHKKAIKEITEHKQEDTLAHKTLTVDSKKKRSVIQDIFDDWDVENAEEDVQSTSKIDHDSVEIELKSLMDETKVNQTVTNKAAPSLQEKISTNKEYADGIRDTSEKKTTKQSTEQTENQKKSKVTKGESASLNKSEKISSTGKSLRSMETRAFNTTPQSQTAVPKNRSRHLTSQIASPAEVTEVLKERLREKQKTIVDAPRGPDIFFVKKLTQRLSSKLAGSPVNAGIPGLIPLPQQAISSVPPSSAQSAMDNCDKKATETSKDSNSDNKELLAILEGDGDPDWSILKPPTLTEENKSPSNVEHIDHSNPPKLDPLVERELALKQLLELPVAPSKKTASRKKKTFRPTPSKMSKDTIAKSPHATQEQKDVNVDLASENAQPNAKSVEIDLSSPRKNDQQDQEGTRVEESRSGRKRKPTEKAREHEQNTIKRQKVYRANDPPEADVNNEKATTKEETSKQLEDKADSKKGENSPSKQPRQSLPKRGSQPIAERKIVVKRLLRQKMDTSKKPVQLKAKISPSKKASPKAVSKASPKRSVESTSSDVKHKKKGKNEIDRLLQDEGVVNLLYDVEHQDKRRLVPITKSRVKVMDLQKVQRELKIRKKLVRNAVLRLRTSTTPTVTKVLPRSKRKLVHTNDSPAEKKPGEQTSSPKASNTAAQPAEFILPAKIRNAADASIIIRRHSSSSFSSASGSPRVSVDEKPAEAAKSSDGTVHSLRSAKRRRDSQDEKMNNAKKTKKKKSDADVAAANTGVNTSTSTSASSTTTASTASANNTDEKINVAARVGRKAEIKKVDKAIKQQDTATSEENVSSKVTTRSSNGAVMPGKVTPKSKKATKSKVTFAKTGEHLDNTEDSSKEEDELSACLAEAATALSVANPGRSGNITRKNKVHPSTVKTPSSESNKTKADTQSQFSNKEINVRRHGNLVQLILTPSSSTKIRNALTLQVMQEFRDALSILKRDDECRVVLLTSTGTSFCEGLDLSMLLHTNKEERRAVAQELAHAVKDFIKSLATFNKPIVAGVQGAAIGLGVTMLPLFDLVIASDKATFCTPYGKLGQIAEGAAVFTLSHILGSAITCELLLGGRTLTASEALRAGLVTRVLWPDRFQVELLPSLRAMSDQSSQSMEATKALLRHSLRKKLDAALESETYLLIQHWCSADCQNAIKAYIDGKIQ
ncbi:titin homolog isoform X2 [Linepithema humile]|uniref:titin homolog isoform X2 n=1 Tax=Linepithema humile TaxID=83485 RepID=UPI00351EBA5B